MTNWIFRLAAGIILLAVLLGAGGYYLTHHVDWIRVHYKRFKAPNVYVFDEVNPQYLATDPAKLIRIAAPENAAQIRAALTDAIWGAGDGPAGVPPAIVVPGAAPPALAALAASSLRLEAPIDLGYKAHIYLLEPQRPNGRLIIYQNGYASTVAAAAPLIGALLEKGYAVAALDYPGYGENGMGRTYIDRFGWYDLSHDRIIAVHDHPMRFYVEPVIAFLNYAAASETYSAFDMTGFSAGGWITTLAAAVDHRIRRSVTVAGGYPLYLRVGAFRNQSPPPQFHQPLLQAANYLEMYVLAGAGEGRRLIQIFNRYDGCCYRNTLGMLYEPAVRDAVARAGGGGFDVLIDESHADHKVSDWATARILEKLGSGN
ncbi:MAG: alpha/beta hydrolase [Alphaproteobacteria bacterium]